MAARILIIDDEKLMRWAVRRKCKEWGYETTEASSLGEALEVLRREPPDLMLLDINLPDGSGISFLRAIRTSVYSGPIIIITADARIAEFRTSMRLSVAGFLSKPLDFEQLSVAIRTALPQH